MKLLERGSIGPQVAFLQIALTRAGMYDGIIDGSFNRQTAESVIEFQRSMRLRPSGCADAGTHLVLLPYYTGFYSSSNAIVPLDFPVIPERVELCSAALPLMLRGLSARFPFLIVGEFGHSVMGRALYYLRFGSGERRVFITAAHHANEYITGALLLRLTEAVCSSYSAGERFGGESTEEIFNKNSVVVIPCVNPDGVDLASGDLISGTYYKRAQNISRLYPEIPFPRGWKANIAGIDLNLQYPAEWETAREIKAKKGYDRPAPRDYPGSKPLEAPESKALHRFTMECDPALVLAFHSQGREIYWKYLDRDIPGAEEMARDFEAMSGYKASVTPYASGHAGYKDWFIDHFARPGFTIEVGSGENPLPNEQLVGIYRDNLGIFLRALM